MPNYFYSGYDDAGRRCGGSFPASNDVAAVGEFFAGRHGLPLERRPVSEVGIRDGAGRTVALLWPFRGGEVVRG